jgi:hypothetical protein
MTIFAISISAFITIINFDSCEGSFNEKFREDRNQNHHRDLGIRNHNDPGDARQMPPNDVKNQVSDVSKKSVPFKSRAHRKSVFEKYREWQRQQTMATEPEPVIEKYDCEAVRDSIRQASQQTKLSVSRFKRVKPSDPDHPCLD